MGRIVDLISSWFNASKWAFFLPITAAPGGKDGRYREINKNNNKKHENKASARG